MHSFLKCKKNFPSIKIICLSFADNLVFLPCSFLPDKIHKAFYKGCQLSLPIVYHILMLHRRSGKMQHRHVIDQQGRAVCDHRHPQARSYHADHRMVIIGFKSDMRFESGLLAQPVQHIIRSCVGFGIDNKRIVPECGKILYDPCLCQTALGRHNDDQLLLFHQQTLQRLILLCIDIVVSAKAQLRCPLQQLF